jgi:hypothetical protein
VRYGEFQAFVAELDVLLNVVACAVSRQLRLPPELTQTVKTLLTVR